MESSIDQYFREEKIGALVLVMVSLVTMAIGIYFLVKTAHPTFRGIAWPLLLFGLIEIVIGSAVYLRTDKQVASLQSQHRSLPEVFKNEESIRMEKVMRNFRIVKVAEITLIIIGILLIMLAGSKSLWVGVGIGLLFQAAFLLGFDKIAEQRGEKYSEFVKGVRHF